MRKTEKNLPPPTHPKTLHLTQHTAHSTHQIKANNATKQTHTQKQTKQPAPRTNDRPNKRHSAAGSAKGCGVGSLHTTRIGVIWLSALGAHPCARESAAAMIVVGDTVMVPWGKTSYLGEVLQIAETVRPTTPARLVCLSLSPCLSVSLCF